MDNIKQQWISAFNNLDIDRMREIISIDSSVINITDESDGYDHWEGNTALTYAAENGRRDIIDLLLDNSVDINHQGYLGNTGLNVLLINKHNELAKYLLDKGADVNILNNDNRNSLIIACINGEEEMVDLIIDKTDDINLIDDLDSFTALMYASYMKENTGIIRKLVNKGALIDTQTNYNMNSLMRACLGGYLENMRTLIELGANIYLISHDCTCLHFALHENNVEIVDYLLNQGLTFGIDKHEGYKKINQETQNYFEDYEGYKEYRMINEEK